MTELVSTLGQAAKKLTANGTQPANNMFARWMDDIWVFSESEASLRRSQVLIQEKLNALRLSLNSAETKIYAGAELLDHVSKVENSAVDSALGFADSGPLELLIDRILNRGSVPTRVLWYGSCRSRCANSVCSTE